MAQVPPDDTRPGRDRVPSWRDRYDAARARGVPLDPKSEPVEGVTAYPTEYATDHLLVTAEGDALRVLLEQLQAAGQDFGWGIELRNIDDTAVAREVAQERTLRWRERLDLPTIHRVRIFPQPSPDRDDQPVPPIDAWRLLQRLRARIGKDVQGVSLDHVLSVNPFGSKTNPFGSKTNPFGSKTNPFGSKTNAPGPESYAMPGSGGKQVVGYVGASPASRHPLAVGKGRRPTVAVLDTGCGAHPWLTDDVVTRYPAFEGRVIGVDDPGTDPEVIGDVSGPFDGELDAASGHGTFISGIIRQRCPDAEIIAVRVADSNGDLLEGDFMLAVRTLVKWMATDVVDGGRPIDVLNLSLGYYHETPEDELFDRTLSALLLAARRHGCAVVCSAGNDSTDRPAFPAALWGWEGADFVVEDPPKAAPHVSVGALNPNSTMALFSNLGPWVRTFAPGASVLSTQPPFNGGVQAGTRADRGGYRRETIDPEDFTGGFALWSGTSFAAPYVAGMLAEEIAAALMSGSLVDERERCKALRRASADVCGVLEARGPRSS